MQYDQKAPSELVLDRNNPRFGLQIAKTEDEALQILLSNADLKELWDSISERGYEPFEPIVAMKDAGELVVLEGNRRLAAIKFLLKPELAPTEALAKRIPRLSPDKKATLDKLPVMIVSDRTEAAGYIGFKHVNGPTRWSSLAKAKFGVDFFETLSNELSPEQRMQSLTKQLGDSRGLIIRLLVSYKIVLQAIKLGIFEKLGVDGDSIEFSHLYTLINNPDSRAFIGLSLAPLSEQMIIDDPVPPTHHAALHELLGYLYGKESVIQAQGTDRPRLQRVLSSKDGIRELRTSRSLDAAEAVAGIISEDWLKTLAKSAALIAKCNADIATIVEALAQVERAEADKILKRVTTQASQIRAAFRGGADV